MYLRKQSVSAKCSNYSDWTTYLPLEITLPSAYHSPSTVNMKAKEFVIGTVRLNSTHPNDQHTITFTNQQ